MYSSSTYNSNYLLKEDMRLKSNPSAFNDTIDIFKSSHDSIDPFKDMRLKLNLPLNNVINQFRSFSVN